MELDLGKRTVFKVKFDGSVYDVKKPSVSEVSSFNHALKGKDELEQLDVTKAFINKLGLPEAVINDLEMDQFTHILEAVAGVKKS